MLLSRFDMLDLLAAYEDCCGEHLCSLYCSLDAEETPPACMYCDSMELIHEALEGLVLRMPARQEVWIT